MAMTAFVYSLAISSLNIYNSDKMYPQSEEIHPFQFLNIQHRFTQIQEVK